ncbi:MAG: hypothetical protein ACK47B_22965 [Armatimonadota bacterium]
MLLDAATWPWLALILLGAYHGLNPGMGWLFAVALGLQEGKRNAVLRALPPIALGHALSVAVVAGLFLLLRAAVPPLALKIGAAALLCGFGIYRLVRSRHPSWVGMRVGFRDLVLWSFVMASAHGAGLMLLPVFLGRGGARHEHPHAGHAGHAGHLSSTWDTPGEWLAAVGVHTAAHLVVAGLIALLVYEKLGVAILRRAWLNLDLLWCLVLIASGILVLVT